MPNLNLNSEKRVEKDNPHLTTISFQEAEESDKVTWASFPPGRTTPAPSAAPHTTHKYACGTIQFRRNSFCLKCPVCTLFYTMTVLGKKNTSSFHLLFPQPASITKTKGKKNSSLKCIYFPRIFRIQCGVHYCCCHYYHYYIITSYPRFVFFFFSPILLRQFKNRKRYNAKYVLLLYLRIKRREEIFNLTGKKDMEELSLEIIILLKPHI